MLLEILLGVFILLLVLGFFRGPAHYRAPSGLLGLVLVVLLIFVLAGAFDGG